MNHELLRSVSCLRNLTDDELAAFGELLELQEYKAGDRIVWEGRPMQAFSIVAKGLVHVRRMAQKREMLLGRIAAGGFFGEINLFDESTATASIYAIEKVTLGVIAYDVLREFLSANPSVGYKIVSALMVEMSRRLRQTNDRFVNSVYWSSLSTSPPES